jgi:hypothetical protein
MAERRHGEPFIELRIVWILKAELQHLPPLTRVFLVDVDVGQREREPRLLARPCRACDKANPPVIDTPVCGLLQYLGSDEPRGLQAVVQVLAAEGPGLGPGNSPEAAEETAWPAERAQSRWPGPYGTAAGHWPGPA